MKTSPHSSSNTVSRPNHAASPLSESIGYDDYLFEIIRSRQWFDEVMPYESERGEERRSIDWEGRHSSVSHLLKYVW